MEWSGGGLSWARDVVGRADHVCARFREAAIEIRAKLLDDGALLFKGMKACSDPDVFQGIIDALGFQSRDYIGGSSPRSAIKGHIVEATRTPSNWSIILHQEMAYVTAPPEIIAFFCIKSAPCGGGSLIGDMRQMTDLVDPDVVQLLSRRGLKLRRTLPSHDRLHLKPGIKKSWQETVGVTDKTKAKAVCDERGWTSEWSGADLILWQDTIKPIRRHPEKQTDIWFNQAHFWGAAAMIEWAKLDRRSKEIEELRLARKTNPNLLDAICFDDGEPIPDSIVLSLFTAVKSLERPVDLSVGDLLILDNQQYAHGRAAFRGERKLSVALANWN